MFREWCQKPTTRSGVMVSLEAITNIVRTYKDPGYASVYIFDKEAADTILIQGNSQRFDRFPVYAKSVVIDLDDGDATLPLLERELSNRGLGYEVWSSGGKGYHVIINHQRLKSNDLPHSHRIWVESLGVPCDLSLYQHGRILSLPGRVHPKTGKRKALVKVVEGETLNLLLLKKPELTFNFASVTEEPELLRRGLRRLATMAEIEPYVGNRHVSIWGAAKDLAEAGLSHDVVLALMLEVNHSWQHPKDEADVVAAVTQAFK